MHLVNSFISTTMCDDLARATEAQDGKKQFWTLAQSKYISEGAQKWTLLGSKVVHPGGPVFGPFILSDVLKFCRLLCAQNVKGGNVTGREDRKRFYNSFCISSNLSNFCYLIQVSSPHPLLYVHCSMGVS